MRLLLILSLLLVPWTATWAEPEPAKIAAYRALARQDLRLAPIGHSLRAANTPFCKKLERNPGWVLHDEQQYPDGATARAAFEFRQPVEISAIVPGSTAEALGLKSGDGLVAIAGRNWVWENGSKQSAKRIEAVQNELRDALASNMPLDLTLETENGKEQFQIHPPAICASRFWVDASPRLEAGADGYGVRITEGLMVFTRHDDNELAAAVAHELSHNLLRHRDRLKKGKRGTREVLATEIEADKLSVWLMANAGYDPKAALRFTERYGRKTGLGIFSEGTHLRWKNRLKVIQAEIYLMNTTARDEGLLPPPLLVGG